MLVCAFSWEQRKLGDIGETYTGLSGKTKEDFGHGNAKFVTYMNVFSNSIADSSMTESVEIDKKQNEVKYGDVFFTTSSETPDEVGMSSVWLENGENTYLNSFCFGYRPSVKINPYYMAYMLRSDNVRKNIVFLAQGISRYNISKNKMMEISVPLPALEEQQRIGEYFRNLDTLITLHQRECFSFDFGSRSAKVAQKTISWEQRKLGDMCDEFQSGKSIKSSEITDSGEYAVYGGNGFRGYTDTYNHDGDYALIGRQGALCGNMNFSSGKAYFTEHAVAVHGNADNDTLFLYYLLDLMNLGQYSGQSAQPGLAVNKIIQLKTKAPKLDEQRLISSFFKQLDTLITLHQRKQETIIKQRKVLQQYLLNGIVRVK